MGEPPLKSFDAELFARLFYVNGLSQGQKQIAEPGIPISIRFKVPDNMVNRQPYMIRDCKIIRLHEDESGNVAVDVLNADFNSSTSEATFETDKLSVFALTYKDTSYSPSYPATGIKVSPESITLTKKGETAQLTAEVTPSYADNKTVTWKSGDEKVAIVDENGRVTAIGNGTATITVAAGDGKATASVTITVKVPKNNKTTCFGRLKTCSVKQTKTSVTLQWDRIKGADGYLVYGKLCNVNGKEYKYKRLATLTSGRTQTWTQKGLKKGTFYQYVVKAYKMVDGKKVVTDVSTSVHTVTQGGAYEIAQSVSVTRIGNQKNTLEITMAKGQKAQITAKEVQKDHKIKHHRKVCYESSDTEVATVTSKGCILAEGKGTCMIWVYAQNGVYKELTVTVK